MLGCLPCDSKPAFSLRREAEIYLATPPASTNLSKRSLHQSYYYDQEERYSTAAINSVIYSISYADVDNFYQGTHILIWYSSGKQVSGWFIAFWEFFCTMTKHATVETFHI
jgi:hypothetical protein